MSFYPRLPMRDAHREEDGDTTMRERSRSRSPILESQNSIPITSIATQEPPPIKNDSSLRDRDRSRSPRKRLEREPRAHSFPKTKNTVPQEQVPGRYPEDLVRNKQIHLNASTAEEVDIRDTGDSDALNFVLRHPLYRELQRELDESCEQRKQLENHLSQKASQLAESESRLSERDSELAQAQKGWRKVASELDKIRAQGQGFYQVTDQYLIDKASSLRYSVRNFAIQYFEGEIKGRVEIKNRRFLNSYIAPTTPGSTAYTYFLHSPTRCPSLIQGILWRVLCSKVFGQFDWAGKTGEHMYQLNWALRPRPVPPNFRPDPEAERKFRTWSATTTGLLLDTVDLREGSDAHKELKVRKRGILNDICGVLEPFARHNDKGFEQEVIKILDDAINLDIEMSRQVAKLMWLQNPREFDPSHMVLEGQEESQTGPSEIQLVVAPGLRKRGKSNGEDFKVETILLKTEVSCQPITPSPSPAHQPQSQRGRGWFGH